MMEKQEKEAHSAKRPAGEPPPTAASATPAASAEAEESPHPEPGKRNQMY
jgi:hypothetical protein